LPVDVISATIECFVENKTIWAPSEWSNLIKNARVNPFPSKVENLKNSNFIDWKNVANQCFTQLLNTNRGGAVQITKIKYFLFIKPLNRPHEIQIFRTYKSIEVLQILKLKKKKLFQNYHSAIRIVGLYQMKKNNLFKLCIIVMA